MTEATSEQKRGLKEFVAEYSPFLLILPFLFFIVSYLFNLSYFLMFGIKLWKMPLSSADYIVSVNALGILFMFLFIYCISILILFNLIGIKNKKYRSVYSLEDESVKYKLKSIARRNIFRFIFILIVVSIFSLLAQLFFARHEFMLINIISIFLCIILSFILKYNVFSLYIVTYLTMCMLLICVIIYYALFTAIDDYKDKYSIVDINGKLYYNMRSFDSGFFVRRIDSDEVLFITRKNEKLIFSPPNRLVDFINKKEKSPLPLY